MKSSVPSISKDVSGLTLQFMNFNRKCTHLFTTMLHVGFTSIFWIVRMLGLNCAFGTIHLLCKHIFRYFCPPTLGGIASICFRFYFQQTLRIQIQGCQGCQKTRNFMRNSKILIARSTIQPKLSKIKNNLPFLRNFDEFLNFFLF